MPPLVWLITGTSYVAISSRTAVPLTHYDSTGIGHQLALAVLERGDHVIATSRSSSFYKLADLSRAGAATMELDVTEPMPKLESVAERAMNFYGHVDVLVNNAGTHPRLFMSPVSCLSQCRVLTIRSNRRS